MKLNGKTVFITGAAKRLGRAIALGVATEGANVAIHYHKSKKEAVELQAEIVKAGSTAIIVKADCKKPKEIKKAILKAVDFFGSIDVLVNNAAIFYPTKIDDVDDKIWDDFLDVNLKAPFYFAKTFTEASNDKLRKIINIADGYGSSPVKGFVPYGVSKGALIALTKGLAKTYAPSILVNSICPGPVLPPNGADEEQQARSVKSTILKREGQVEDIVKTVVYLAENDYMTGHEIYVDGGKWA